MRWIAPEAAARLSLLADINPHASGRLVRALDLLETGTPAQLYRGGVRMLRFTTAAGLPGVEVHEVRAAHRYLIVRRRDGDLFVVDFV